MLSTCRINILSTSASRCFSCIGNDLHFLRDIQQHSDEQHPQHNRGIDISLNAIFFSILMM
jgi:hypothetical protein